MQVTDDEMKYMTSFENKYYRPELLFHNQILLIV